MQRRPQHPHREYDHVGGGGRDVGPHGSSTTAVPKMAATCSKTRGAAGGGFSTAAGGVAARSVVAKAPMG